MIIHNCIECDYNEFVPLCDDPPKIEKYICPSCNYTQYIYHSMINPRTYREEDLIIDEINKTITIKLL